MERYKPIKGYEGYYEVSNMGNVLSLSRKTLGRWGKMKMSPGRLLKPEVSNVGYVRVQLSKNGKRCKYLVHRLVAQTFIPNENNSPCVNHKDNNRQNNSLENLEWCTYKENSEHGVRLGTIKGRPKK